MAVFLGVLVIGFIYEWKKGALGMGLTEAVPELAPRRAGPRVRHHVGRQPDQLGAHRLAAGR